MKEARRLQPSRGRAWRPFRGFLGGGAVAASLGLHGVGAALAVLAWPTAPSTVTGPPAAVSAVEFELNGGLDSAEALRGKGVAAPTAPRPATPRRLVTAPPPRPAAANAERAPSTSATPSNVLATVAPPLSPDATRPFLGPALSPATVRRFALSAGSVASQAFRTGAGTTPATTGDALRETADAVAALPEELADTPAKVLVRAPAPYPEAARRAEIETDVPLVLTIAVDGHVSSAIALAHPGYGLEEAAVSAARAYVFRPAERQGRAVAVRMRWVIQFRLR